MSTFNFNKSIVTGNINGKSFTYNGSGNLSIVNNKVYIDGKEFEDLDLIESKEIIINIDSNVSSLEVDNCSSINVSGEVGKINTTNGNISCSSISGNVKTVNGNVFSSGNILGKVKTVNGNIQGC